MGREIFIQRLDVTTKGNFLRDSDKFICGRTDFTNSLANLFYNKNVDYIIIDKDGVFIKQDVPFDVIDEYKYASDRNFNMEFDIVKFNAIGEIIDKYIEESNYILEDTKDKLYDARMARQHCNNYDEFVNFSDLIDDLKEYIKEFNNDAQVFSEYFYDINSQIINLMRIHEDGLIKSYIVICLSE